MARRARDELRRALLRGRCSSYFAPWSGVGGVCAEIRKGGVVAIPARPNDMVDANARNYFIRPEDDSKGLANVGADRSPQQENWRSRRVKAVSQQLKHRKQGKSKHSDWARSKVLW